MQEDNNLLSDLQREFKQRQEGTYRKPRKPAIKKAKARSFLGLKVATVFTLLVLMLGGGYWFRSNYHFQSPVSFHPLWAKNETQKVMVPMVLGKEIARGSAKSLTMDEKKSYIKTKKYPVIIAGVWNRESQSGKDDEGHHIYCSDMGYSNEFGFNVYGDNRTCYPTFEEAVDNVDAWFDKNLKKMSVDQALCLYNQGGNGTESDCKYVHDYRADENRVWAEFNK